MKVLYTRVSTLNQNIDRQRTEVNKYDLVLEDRCSGSIPLFEREQGKAIKGYVDKKIITELYVHSIDRLGRDLRDIINNIHYFNSNNICVHFITQGLRTLDKDGKENAIAKMMISILGTVGEMERNQIKERQLEGVKLAKARGVYKGRKPGSKENILAFLSKDKNQKALALLNKGYKATEISKILGIHVNTITKIKKVGVVG